MTIAGVIYLSNSLLVIYLITGIVLKGMMALQSYHLYKKHEHDEGDMWDTYRSMTKSNKYLALLSMFGYVVVLTGLVIGYIWYWVVVNGWVVGE